MVSSYCITVCSVVDCTEAMVRMKKTARNWTGKRQLVRKERDRGIVVTHRSPTKRYAMAKPCAVGFFFGFVNLSLCVM